MQDSRRNVFFRIAAILLLVVLIVGVLCDLTYYIVRNVNYSYYIWGSGSVFKQYSVANLLNFITETVPMIRAMAGAVLALLAVIMLFAAKEKVAGRIIIISAIISYVLYMTTMVIYIILRLDDKLALTEYLKANTWNMIKNAAISALVILFGLLLTGVFKDGSKVFAFILCGLFAAGILGTLIEFISAIPTTVYVFKNGDAFYKMSMIISRIAQIMGCVRYTAYVLFCLGVALKPRESVKTEPEIS